MTPGAVIRRTTNSGRSRKGNRTALRIVFCCKSLELLSHKCSSVNRIGIVPPLELSRALMYLARSFPLINPASLPILSFTISLFSKFILTHYYINNFLLISSLFQAPISNLYWSLLLHRKVSHNWARRSKNLPPIYQIASTSSRSPLTNKKRYWGKLMRLSIHWGQMCWSFRLISDKVFDQAMDMT